MTLSQTRGKSDFVYQPIAVIVT